MNAGLEHEDPENSTDDEIGPKPAHAEPVEDHERREPGRRAPAP